MHEIHGKELAVSCPIYHSKKTVYIYYVSGTNGEIANFNGCEDMTDCDLCKECAQDSLQCFRDEYKSDGSTARFFD